VLFFCIGNSCRSPMAEAMARTLGRGRIEAHSAGLLPTGRIAPPTLAALAALGYPVDGLRSKGLDQVPLRSVELVVSLIGSEGLRALPQDLVARREAWSVRDPFGDDQEVYLRVARDLEARVRNLVVGLLDELGP
jgi:arsenate reductase